MSDLDKITKNFQDYFSEIKRIYNKGSFTEMSFRTQLENLIKT